MKIVSRTTTTTQQSTCAKLQKAVGCAGEQEAEVPADGRLWSNKWHSYPWTRVEALENKRRSVTRDDLITNQTKVVRQVVNGKQKIVAEAPADKRCQHSKRWRGWRSRGTSDREQEAKGQAEARERLVVKRCRQRRSGRQETTVR